MSGRCGICERKREAWPWTVTMRNGLRVNACQDCWQRWPDPWKQFPAYGGFGRGFVADELEEAV